MGPFGSLGSPYTFVDDGSEGGLVFRSRLMLLSHNLLPEGRVDRWERSVAFRSQMHARNHHSVRPLDRLGIYVGTSHHGDRLRGSPQRVAARNRQRSFQTWCDKHARRRKAGVARYHDVRPALERTADGQECPSPHHYGLAHGDRTKLREVGFEPPGQAAGSPDHVVVGDCGDEDYFWSSGGHGSGDKPVRQVTDRCGINSGARYTGTKLSK